MYKHVYTKFYVILRGVLIMYLGNYCLRKLSHDCLGIDALAESIVLWRTYRRSPLYC